MLQTKAVGDRLRRPFVAEFFKCVVVLQCAGLQYSLTLISAAADRLELCVPVVVALRAALRLILRLIVDGLRQRQRAISRLLRPSFRKLCRQIRSSCVKCVGQHGFLLVNVFVVITFYTSLARLPFFFCVLHFR